MALAAFKAGICFWLAQIAPPPVTPPPMSPEAVAPPPVNAPPPAPSPSPSPQIEARPASRVEAAPLPASQIESAPAVVPLVPAPGRYAGVVPGPEARNPLPQPKSDPPRLVWTGFQMAGDHSELFLQTTRPVNPVVGRASAAGGHPSLSVFLRNCRIHMRNNGRAIDTRFFATPVEGVSARQRSHDVEIKIDLKEAAAPELRLDPGPGGSQFAVLVFPPGRPEPLPRLSAGPVDDRVADVAVPPAGMRR